MKKLRKQEDTQDDFDEVIGEAMGVVQDFEEMLDKLGGTNKTEEHVEKMRLILRSLETAHHTMSVVLKWSQSKLS